jgi:hypothetical protein
MDSSFVLFGCQDTNKDMLYVLRNTRKGKEISTLIVGMHLTCINVKERRKI